VWIAQNQIRVIEIAKNNADTLAKINALRLKNQVISETDLIRTQLLSEQYAVQLRSVRQDLLNKRSQLRFLIGSTDSVDVDCAWAPVVSATTLAAHISASLFTLVLLIFPPEKLFMLAGDAIRPWQRCQQENDSATIRQREGQPMLSRKEIDHYRETGWLVVEDMLDKATLSQARQAIAEFVAGAAKVTQHDKVYDLEPGHRPEAPRVRRIKTPHTNHRLFWEIAKAPKLLGILEQLLGPSGVRLHGSKINLKAPHYGSPVEWHQDWAFYPHTNDDILAVGVMLDDMLMENGPLMVMPGTHKGPTYDHHVDGYFAGAIIVFIWAFTDLGTPIIFGFSRVVPVQIFDAINDLNTNPLGYALVVFVLALTVILFVISKHFLARKRYEMMARGHSGGERRAGAHGCGCSTDFQSNLKSVLERHLQLLLNSRDSLPGATSACELRIRETSSTMRGRLQKSLPRDLFSVISAGGG